MRALNRLGLAWLLFGAATPGHAGVDARLALTSAYLQHGLEQSQSAVTYQGALEYQGRRWFAGVWGSRVSYGGYDQRTGEIDYYAGYGRRLNPDLALEGTVIRYTYLGESPRDDDWTELQLSAYIRDRWTTTWGIARNWWATDRTSQFVEGTYRYPLPADLTLDVTAGYQFAQRAAGVRYGYGEAGISRHLDEVVVRLGYAVVDSEARDRFPHLADNHWVVSLTWQP